MNIHDVIIIYVISAGEDTKVHSLQTDVNTTVIKCLSPGEKYTFSIAAAWGGWKISLLNITNSTSGINSGVVILIFYVQSFANLINKRESQYKPHFAKKQIYNYIFYCILISSLSDLTMT